MKGRPRRLLLGTLAFLGLGAVNTPAQMTQQKEQNAAIAGVPETKQQPGRTVRQQHGIRAQRAWGFVWLGRAKRGNRRGRSHWDYNR